MVLALLLALPPPCNPLHQALLRRLTDPGAAAGDPTQLLLQAQQLVAQFGCSLFSAAHDIIPGRRRLAGPKEEVGWGRQGAAEPCHCRGLTPGGGRV
ncbi:hypothetical protein HaLaN_00811 [Haematococcus lacustris]|uniref:Uncharacterized protein n=1 Tax=Haematococcus lacustris TaxID=44745 RepID=A0A699YGR6_HAELA|nr:hypothetical protein HaLaN_00811 [Haematococcus lacustris]